MLNTKKRLKHTIEKKMYPILYPPPPPLVNNDRSPRSCGRGERLNSRTEQQASQHQIPPDPAARPPLVPALHHKAPSHTTLHYCHQRNVRTATRGMCVYSTRDDLHMILIEHGRREHTTEPVMVVCLYIHECGLLSCHQQTTRV